MKQSEKYTAKIKALAAEVKKIHAFAEGEGRDISADESAKVDDILAQIDAIRKSVEQLKSVEDAEDAAAADDAAVEASKKKSAGRYSKPVEGVIHQDIAKYSVVRAMRCMVERGQLDGLEAEVNQEFAKKSGKTPQGFFMPLQTYGNLDTTTGAGAVSTLTDNANFIELLRNKMLASELGCKVMSDLDGKIAIPRQTGGGTAYWINSDGSGSVTISNQTIGQVPLVPNTVGALTAYTRQFLKQTSIDAEAFVKNDLAEVIARELDRVVFAGSGSGSEPEGVLYNSDVSVTALGTNGDAPTWASMVALETAVSAGNADLGNLAYVTSAQGRGKLKTTLNSSNTAAKFLAENNEVNGYALHATNQLPHNLTKGPYGTGLSPIIFGNWQDIIIGLWGALDVVVNPYTNDAYGSVRITCMQEADIAIRHPASFAMILDMVTT